MSNAAEENRVAINAARGAYSKPYDDALAKAQAANVAKPNTKRQRAKRLAGVTKWESGMPTLKYVKDARTGITQAFSENRKEDRAASSDWNKRHHTRGKHKRSARITLAAIRHSWRVASSENRAAIKAMWKGPVRK